MHAGEIIKLMRIKNKISQIDFAKKTGISANYLSLIENGKRNPRVEYYKKAAQSLGIPVNLLLWENIDLSAFKDKDVRATAKKIEEKLLEVKELLFKEVMDGHDKKKKL